MLRLVAAAVAVAMGYSYTGTGGGDIGPGHLLARTSRWKQIDIYYNNYSKSS